MSGVSNCFLGQTANDIVINGDHHYIIVNKMFERFKMPRGLFKSQKDTFARENPNHLNLIL